MTPMPHPADSMLYRCIERICEDYAELQGDQPSPPNVHVREHPLEDGHVVLRLGGQWYGEWGVYISNRTLLLHLRFVDALNEIGDMLEQLYPCPLAPQCWSCHAALVPRPGMVCDACADTASPWEVS